MLYFVKSQYLKQLKIWNIEFFTELIHQPLMVIHFCFAVINVPLVLLS